MAGAGPDAHKQELCAYNKNFSNPRCNTIAIDDTMAKILTRNKSLITDTNINYEKNFIIYHIVGFDSNNPRLRTYGKSDFRL